MVTLVRTLRPRRLLAALAFLGLASCGGSDAPTTTAPESPTATALTVSQTSVSLSFLGETVTLSATVLDQFARTFNATITWSSDDPAVAAVTAAGVVSAVGNGVTTVRATSGSLSASATVTVQQVATSVAIVSGDNQVGTVGQALAETLVVRSEDQGGAPVSGTNVTFSVESANGSVSQATATSDAEALASTAWTLGTTSGLQQVTAAVEGATTGWAVFGATAQAGPAASLAKTSGDQQSGTVGIALPNPVTVTLVDEFGNGVDGGTVAFAVTSGGGSVTPSGASTGDDGTAQAIWTMGPGLGANTLSATASGLPPVEFTATAGAAKADLVPSAPATLPQNPTSLQSFEVSSTITNAGHLATGSGFQVQLLIDGVGVGTTDLSALDPGASSKATFAAGPLTAGSHSLRIVVDGGGAVDESNEGNNTVESSRDIASATLVSPGTPIDGISGAEGVEQLFTLEVPASQPGTMVVSLSGGSGDVDLYVNFGERPASRDDYECQSGNPDTTEKCVFNAAEPGTYHILLYAFSDFSGTSLLATTGGPVIPYNIELEFIHHGTGTQDSAFVNAAAEWMKIIPGDISDVNFANSPVETNACADGQARIEDVVDDLRIFVSIIDIDGPGGTLAQAGPCVLRGLSELPALGQMQFDAADLDVLDSQGALLPVVLHEMGHVLGLGTIWDRLDLLQNPSLPNSQGADTHFSGARAIAAFDELGGSSVYTLGQKVPVENVAGEGSGDAHWRESVLDEELMTPFFNSGETNPLSKISIESMADLGYSVDPSRAQPFSKVYRAPATGATEGRLIDLSGDVLRGPLFVVDVKGRLRQVTRR